MVKKVMRVLSGVAAAMLIAGVAATTDIEQVKASGTNTITVMSQGVAAASDTIFSDEIAGNIAALVMVVIGIYLVMGHGGVALVPATLLFLGAGLIIQGKEAIEGAGYSAVGL